MLTTVGQILVNEALPEKYRDYNRQMGASEAKAVLTRMAFEDPQLSRETSNKLVMLGAQSSFDEGITLSISDTLNPVKDRAEMFKYLRAQKARILASDATQEEKDRAIEALNDKVRVYLTDAAYNSGLAAQNPFALQVASKARGSPAQLVSLQTSPGTYTDTNGRQIPIFIEHSFAEGLSPMEYWAGTYGARKSVTSTKFATRDAGALGKQFNRAVMRLVVADEDCGTNAGIPVKPDDIDNLGSVLSSDAPPYKAGTVVTKEVMQDLKDKYDEILVRSPLTCGCKEGLCAKCAGIRETGKFPEIGSHVGLQASSALAERIAQGSLNCLVEGTMVRVVGGSKPIEEIKPGDMVWASDLGGNPSKSKVVAVYDNGIQPCYETEFSCGFGSDSDMRLSFILRSTIIHKILGSTGGELYKFEVGIEGEFWAYVANRYVGKTLAKRVSQKPIGDKHVYDIEIEHPDHIFFLENGLIVSNTKHSSGVSQGKGKQDDGDTYAGFDVIDQLFQVPKEFPHRAAVASVTGNVESVEPAPQGGWNIVVNGKTHYAISETKPRVKVGDYVEAGDQLSTGLMNPADVVKYKGIGEGRRYLMNRATKAYKDSGYAVNRRNMEVLVRGFLDNVRVNGNEGLGDFLPDDVVSYSALASTYRPRRDSKTSPVNAAIGSYLEEPVMHYTIGTRITRNVANQLKKHGHSNVFVNPNPPGFEPEATPLKLVSRHEKDWVDQLGGTYLKSNILNAAHRGATSEIHSLQPEHAMARGVELGNPPDPKRFGKKWVY